MATVLQPLVRPRYGRRVSIPKTLRVGLPSSFLTHLRAFGQAEVRELDGQWVLVKGGPLPVEVLLRIDQAEDGRFMVTGLLLGLRTRSEITWETLRRIKPASIVSMIFSGFDPRNPLQEYARTDPAPPQRIGGDDFDQAAWEADDEDLPLIDHGSAEYREHLRAAAAYRLWSTARGSASVTTVEPQTKPRASVATDLAAFASTYQRHLATTPRKALQATADELHCSRATVVRRIAECRELGLLPPKGVS